MLKGLLLQSGRLLLAGAFGIKRAEEFPVWVRVLCCFYPLIWMLSFIGFGTGDEWISWILSIGMPVLYAIFVIVVRLKNRKQPIKPDSAKPADEQLSEAPEAQTVTIAPINEYLDNKKNKEVSQTTEKHHNKKRTAPYIASIVILSAALIASLSACLITNNQKSLQIEELQKQSEELSSEYQKIKRQNEILTRRVEIREEQLSELKKEKSELNSKLSDYQLHTCFVNDGSRDYHKLDCPYLDTSRFYVYGINYAENNGYIPCWHCCWDQYLRYTQSR